MTTQPSTTRIVGGRVAVLVVLACSLSAAAQEPAPCAPDACSHVQLRLDEGFAVSRQILADLPATPAPARQPVTPAGAAAASPASSEPAVWFSGALTIAAGMLLQFLLQSMLTRRRDAALGRPVERPPPVIVAPIEAPVAAPAEIAVVSEPEPEPAPESVAAITGLELPEIEAPADFILEPEPPAPSPPPPPAQHETVTLLKRLSALRASAMQPDDRLSTVFRLIAHGQLEGAHRALCDLENPATASIPAGFITTQEHIALRRERELQEKISQLRQRITSEPSVRRLAVADAYLRRQRLDEAAEVLDDLESGIVGA